MQEIQRNNADQHQQGAYRGEDEEFNGCIDSALPAPDSYQEKHRHQRRFEKEIEDEQVQRDKDADHGRFQQQHENVVS